MSTSRKRIRIIHTPTGTILAEGPSGWGITRFEGNYYVRRRYLKNGRYRSTWIPGVCTHKFFYVWLDLLIPDGDRIQGLAWFYWLPNPIFPFIWFRVALSGSHPDLHVEELGGGG